MHSVKKLIISYCDVEKILCKELQTETIDDSILKNIFSARELKQRKLRGLTKSLCGKYVIKRIIFDHIHYAGEYTTVEILNSISGKPHIFFDKTVDKLLYDVKIDAINISISHSKQWIAGMVVFHKFQ